MTPTTPMTPTTLVLLLPLLLLVLSLPSATGYAAGYDRCGWDNHGTNMPGNSGGWSISLQFAGAPVTSYTPGQVHTVTLAGSAVAAKGFVASPVKGTTGTFSSTRAGAFAATDGTVRACNSCSGAVTQTTSALTMGYTFKWTAPAAGTGSVTLWAAGITTSFSGANYETKFVVTEAAAISSSATPSPSPSPASASPTPSATVTPPGSPSASSTPSPSASDSGSASASPSVSASPSDSASASVLPPGVSRSATPSPATRSPSSTRSASGAASASATASRSTAASGSPSTSHTASPSPTPSVSPAACSPDSRCSGRGVCRALAGSALGVCACFPGFAGAACDACDFGYAPAAASSPSPSQRPRASAAGAGAATSAATASATATVVAMPATSAGPAPPNCTFAVFPNALALTDRLGVAWRLDAAAGVLHMQLAFASATAADATWFSIALNDGPGMVGGDSVVVEPARQSVSRRLLAGYTFDTCPNGDGDGVSLTPFSTYAEAGEPPMPAAAAAGTWPNASIPTRPVPALSLSPALRAAPAVVVLPEAVRASAQIVVVATYSRRLAAAETAVGARAVGAALRRDAWLTWAWGPPGVLSLSSHAATTSGALRVDLAAGRALRRVELPAWVLAAHAAAAGLGALLLLLALLIGAVGPTLPADAESPLLGSIFGETCSASKSLYDAEEETAAVLHDAYGGGSGGGSGGGAHAKQAADGPWAWWRRARAQIAALGALLALVGTAVGTAATPAFARGATMHAFVGYAAAAAAVLAAAVAAGGVWSLQVAISIAAAAGAAYAALSGAADAGLGNVPGLAVAGALGAAALLGAVRVACARRREPPSPAPITLGGARRQGAWRRAQVAAAAAKEAAAPAARGRRGRGGDLGPAFAAPNTAVDALVEATAARNNPVVVVAARGGAHVVVPRALADELAELRGLRAIAEEMEELRRLRATMPPTSMR